jgi:CRP-like cAMP-binding protein
MIDIRLNEIFKNNFFDGLLREEFLTIDTKHFIERVFSSNDLIIEQDTTGDVMYLITSGEVLITKVVLDTEIELARQKKGCFFGEMALFDNQLRSANVKAITDVKTYEISSALFF